MLLTDTCTSALMDYHFQKRNKFSLYQDLTDVTLGVCGLCVSVCVCLKSVTCHILFFLHTHTQLCCCFCGNLFFYPFVLICINIQARFECFPLALKNFISTCTHILCTVHYLLHWHICKYSCAVFIIKCIVILASFCDVD